MASTLTVISKTAAAATSSSTSVPSRMSFTSLPVDLVTTICSFVGSRDLSKSIASTSKECRKYAYRIIWPINETRTALAALTRAENWRSAHRPGRNFVELSIQHIGLGEAPSRDIPWNHPIVEAYHKRKWDLDIGTVNLIERMLHYFSPKEIGETLRAHKWRAFDMYGIKYDGGCGYVSISIAVNLADNFARLHVGNMKVFLEGMSKTIEAIDPPVEDGRSH